MNNENIKKNDDDAATLNTNNLVIELLKQNNELQKQIIEMAKEPKIVKAPSRRGSMIVISEPQEARTPKVSSRRNSIVEKTVPTNLLSIRSVK